MQKIKENLSAYIILSLIISFSTVRAQNLTVGSAGKALQIMKSTNYTGSAYLNERFSQSDVITVKGRKINLPALRYNVQKQEVELLDRNEVFTIEDSLKQFSNLDTLGKTHTFVRIPGNKETVFAETLVEGKISLLKQYSAKLVSTEDWYTKKQSKVMTPFSIYYAGTSRNMEKLNLSSKSLLVLFSDKQDQIKTFLKEQEPDLKIDTGLISVFTYYNSAK